MTSGKPENVALESVQEKLVPWSNNKNLTGTVSG